jgi:hypothetical protein
MWREERRYRDNRTTHDAGRQISDLCYHGHSSAIFKVAITTRKSLIRSA